MKQVHQPNFIHVHARIEGQNLRCCKSVSRANKRTRRVQVNVASSSKGGEPPIPPAAANAVAENDREPSRNSHWLIGAALLLMGGTVLLVGIAVQEDAASWKEDTRDASLSIIIPALNEEAGIGSCIRHLQTLDPPPHQIIVADGGSTDRTVDIARELDVDVVPCERGRASQMNGGAKLATGQLLCFVHADNRPPTTLITAARQTLADGRTLVGGFRVIVQHQGRTLQWMTFHQLIKTYYAPLLFRPLSFARGLRAMFGDQNLFCRASDFERLGGFDQRLPIMEDLDLIMRMHAAGPSLADSDEHRMSMSPSPQTGSSTRGISSGTASTWPDSIPAANMPFNRERRSLAPAPIRLRDEDKVRLGKSEALKDLGNRYGAGGWSKPAPNLHEIMAAQSGWKNPGEQAARPGRAAAKAHGSHSWEVSVGARSPTAESAERLHEMEGKKAGHHLLQRSSFGRRKGSKCRGRIKMIMNPPSHTSGRRLAAWGNLKGTWIHFRVATHWYFGGSTEQLHKLYHRIYTDDFR